jgi:hypothetical protein
VKSMVMYHMLPCPKRFYGPFAADGRVPGSPAWQKLRTLCEDLLPVFPDCSRHHPRKQGLEHASKYILTMFAYNEIHKRRRFVVLPNSARLRNAGRRVMLTLDWSAIFLVEGISTLDIFVQKKIQPGIVLPFAEKLVRVTHKLSTQNLEGSAACSQT